MRFKQWSPSLEQNKVFSEILVFLQHPIRRFRFLKFHDKPTFHQECNLETFVWSRLPLLNHQILDEMGWIFLTPRSSYQSMLNHPNSLLYLNTHTQDEVRRRLFFLYDFWFLPFFPHLPLALDLLPWLGDYNTICCFFLLRGCVLV